MNDEDKINLGLVRTEVKAQFEPEEIKAFETFDDFWAKVDVANAYEEEWDEIKEDWKPYYETVYQELKK